MRVDVVLRNDFLVFCREPHPAMRDAQPARVASARVVSPFVSFLLLTLLRRQLRYDTDAQNTA